MTASLLRMFVVWAMPRLWKIISSPAKVEGLRETLLKKAAKLKSGSKEPGKVSAGTIKRSQVSEIAEIKMADLNANDIEAATKIIEGSARAMGLEVVEG